MMALTALTLMKRAGFAWMMVAALITWGAPTPSPAQPVTGQSVTGEPAAKIRAMWVWKPKELDPGPDLDAFIEAIRAARITDVYLFLRARDYTAAEAQIEAILAALQEHGIRAWGMEGWRGYFSDDEGPGGLYAAAEALIAFNAGHKIRFVGFHADLEPQDGQDTGRVRFHNGIPQSRLTSTQAADRDGLMTEWLIMHRTLRDRMQAAALEYGGALPAWVDDYYGEPVQAVLDGVRKPLIEHLMPLVPQYVVMSYNTNPTNVMARVAGELEHATRLGAGPRIVFGLETHAGAGVNVSYADTPGKKGRTVVLQDLAALDRRISESFPEAYLGWAIHDYEGWRTLPLSPDAPASPRSGALP